RDCLPSHPGDFGTDRICSVGSFAVVNGDIGTSPSQSQCDSSSDAATPTSDESNSIVQVLHGVIVCATQPSRAATRHAGAIRTSAHKSRVVACLSLTTL